MDWDLLIIILKVWLFSWNIQWNILFLEIMVTQGRLYRTDYLIAVKDLFNEWTHTEEHIFSEYNGPIFL